MFRKSTAICRKRYFHHIVRPPSVLPCGRSSVWTNVDKLNLSKSSILVCGNELKCGFILRRLMSQNSAKIGEAGKQVAKLESKNIQRLLALAKPEKWKLIGE